MNSPAQPQQTAATLALEDIHLPPQPGLWPPAIGWWILLLLIIGILTFAVIRFRRYRKRRQQIQKIQAALNTLEQHLNAGHHPQTLAEINRLLRTLALMHFPREDIASLSGQPWLEFLDRSGQTQAFTQGAGQLLGSGPYRAEVSASIDIPGLITAVRKWVKTVTRNNNPLRPLYPSSAENNPAHHRQGAA